METCKLGVRNGYLIISGSGFPTQKLDVERQPNGMGLVKLTDSVRRTLSDLLKHHPFPSPPEIAPSLQAWLGFAWRKKPFAHQEETLAFLVGRRYGCLFLEMGTGKTLIACAWLRLLWDAGKCNRALVVCPNSVKEWWRHELSLQGEGQRHKVLVPKGSMKQREKQILESKSWPNTAIVVNYEAIALLEPVLNKMQIDAVVLDESSFIKSHTAKRTRAATRLGAKSMYRLILNGTPVTHSPLDLFAQMRFLDKNILGERWMEFRNEYSRLGGYMGREVIGYRNLDMLAACIAPHAIIKRKDQCLDLPPKLYEIRRVEMPDRTVYDAMEKEFIVWLSNTQAVTASAIVTKVLKLSQIAGGFLIDQDGVAHPLSTQPKLEELDHVLEEALAVSGRKAVVWCRFVHECQAIYEKYQREYGAVQFWGEVDTLQRETNRRAFQTDPKCRLFVGQYQTGGFGIDLTAADTVIFYSNDYSYGNREQAEARCHRAGQNKAVTYIDLICSRTVDDAVLRVVRKKEKLEIALVNYMKGDH